MSAFVLLWGSAAIFTRWGLDHASVFALLILRFALALAALLLVIVLLPAVKKGREEAFVEE